MSTLTLEERRTVPRKPPRKSDEPTRDRIDLRADPDWVARIERQAERHGISVSAYIRLAVTGRLESDEATDPTPKS